MIITKYFQIWSLVVILCFFQYPKNKNTNFKSTHIMMNVCKKIYWFTGLWLNYYKLGLSLLECKWFYLSTTTMFLSVHLFHFYFRCDQDHELKSKVATIEDLHSRLKINVDNIQQLNQQVWIFLHEAYFMFERWHVKHLGKNVSFTVHNFFL